MKLLVGVVVVAASGLYGQGMAGDWQVVMHRLGAAQYVALHLNASDDRITGALAGMKVDCHVTGNVCEGTVQRGTNPVSGKVTITLRGDELTGVGTYEDTPFDFTARHPAVRPANPRTHQFTPVKFHNYFSPLIEPVLHIAAGDTVDTKSVNAGGTDENGKRRVRGGNPLTGPFYVDGAWPGDTLVIKLNRVRLNRDTAGSGTEIVGSALAPYYLHDLKYDDKVQGDWSLDRAAGFARLTKPTEHLKNYTVALKPMMGCIGVAPPQDQQIRSGYLGPWGGNMDYNQLGEGATLYLPVFHPGALLFLGDGHAAEGDGELTGDALETSMEFSFTVEVIKGHRVPMPRVENAQYRMASGIGNSLQDALQEATTNLSQWLADDYKLTPNEIALVLGTAIHYEVAEVVDPLVHIVAKIDKKALAGLQ